MGSSARAQADDVAVLRWPADAEARALLISRRTPRLLVVATDAPAPLPLDDREDWLREPVDPADLVVRVDALRRRLRTDVPRLDEHGLLHHRDRWVAISDAQLAVVRLLVDSYDEVVPTEQLADAYEAAGGTNNPTSLRTALARIRTRVAEVDLRLLAVRGRGTVLTTED